MNKTDRPKETFEVLDVLIDNFPDMIHSVDTSGKIVYANRMVTSLLGHSTDDLYTMNIRQLYPPEILEAVEKGFQEVKETGEKSVESLLMAKDGTRIPVEMRTLVLHDAHGSFAKTFTISRDMRKLKEMQDSLIHAGRLAAIGELAAGVVHDLNNPLTAIILASSLMEKMTTDVRLDAEAIREQCGVYCETVKEAADTMEALTTRLRDFSRGVKEQHSAVDLFDPIHDALFILAHRIRHSDVRVSCPVVKARHRVQGDRNQIEQVFLNMVANACDAMAQCPTRHLTIDVTPESEDGKAFWCCSIRDTGEGMTPETQQRIFQSFFTTKPRGKGTGLGLSIVRSIIKEHNGEIRVTSARDNGTTFFIRLPATPIGL